jgi:hypothetical protein
MTPLRKKSRSCPVSLKPKKLLYKYYQLHKHAISGQQRCQIDAVGHKYTVYRVLLESACHRH